MAESGKLPPPLTTPSAATKSTTPIPGEPNTNGPTDTNGRPDMNSNINTKSNESLGTKTSVPNVSDRVSNTPPTDVNGTPGFVTPTERTDSQKGPDRPGIQLPTNNIQSQDLSQGENFQQKEENHPHVNNFTPNTTMSGGPFTPDTFDNRNNPLVATPENNVPVKTYIRHPFEAAGNLAGVTPVVVEDKPLSEREVDQRIAQVLKDNGMDSGSQLRAFAQIKVILNAWEPQDSDKSINRKTVLEEQATTNNEVTEQMKTDEQKDRDAQTVANLKKSMQSGQVATT